MGTGEILQTIMEQIAEREGTMQAQMTKAFEIKDWKEVAHTDGYLDALRDLKQIIHQAFDRN